MRPAAGRRMAALAGVAALAIAAAAVAGHRHGQRGSLPQGAGPWNAALATAFTPRHRTACGVAVTATTVGVGHPVLPCGVRLYVRHGDITVLTTVIDRGDVPPGRELDLTPALAQLLGVVGTQRVEWRFTR